MARVIARRAPAPTASSCGCGAADALHVRRLVAERSRATGAIAPSAGRSPIRQPAARLRDPDPQPAPTSLTARRGQLLDDLASQASVVVRTWADRADLQGVSTSCALRADELRLVPARIVAANDAERRGSSATSTTAPSSTSFALAGPSSVSPEALAPGRPEQAAQMLRELRDQTDLARETLLDLAGGIYPATLEDRGIAAALEEQARAAGAPVAVDAHGFERLAIETEAAVYFVCLEAMQNAQKYARASHVDVRLGRDDGHLAFEVRDDGVGFDRPRSPGRSAEHARSALGARRRGRDQLGPRRGDDGARTRPAARGGADMNAPVRGARLARVVHVVSLAILLLATVGAVFAAHGNGPDVFFGLITLIVISAYSTLGRLIVTRAGNPIGWVFLGMAAAAAITLPATAYIDAAYKVPYQPSLPGTEYAGVARESRAGSPRHGHPHALPALPNRISAEPALAVGGLDVAHGSRAVERVAHVASRRGVRRAWAVSHGQPVRPVVHRTLRFLFFDVGAVLVLVAALASIASLIVRFRRARGEERQQIKWLMLVALAALILFLFLGLFGLTAEPGDHGVDDTIWAILVVVLLVGIPIATALAIFRYRLYDVDVVISKTIVYTASPCSSRRRTSRSWSASARCWERTLGYDPADRRDRCGGRRVPAGPATDPAHREPTRLRQACDAVRGHGFVRSQDGGGSERRRRAPRHGRDRRARRRRDRRPSHARAGRRERTLRHVAAWRAGGGADPRLARRSRGRADRRDRDREAGQRDLCGRPSALSWRTWRATPGRPFTTSCSPQIWRPRRASSRPRTRRSNGRASAWSPARDAQRRRLERELRDGVGTELAEIRDEIGWTPNASRPSRRSSNAHWTISGRANTALEELREVARGIFPPLLIDQASPPRWTRSVGSPDPTRISLSTPRRRARASTPAAENAVYFCCVQPCRMRSDMPGRDHHDRALGGR
jgi:signal transduction histidine kinase